MNSRPLEPHSSALPSYATPRAIGSSGGCPGRFLIIRMKNRNSTGFSELADFQRFPCSIDFIRAVLARNIRGMVWWCQQGILTVVEPLLQSTNRGIYCRAGDFYVDPWGAVDYAVITHAHGDHARGGSRPPLATVPEWLSGFRE